MCYTKINKRALPTKVRLRAFFVKRKENDLEIKI